MGSAISKAFLRGFVLPDLRRKFWAAQSGEYTGAGTRLGPLPQGSPQPGVPEPEQDTAMELKSGGTQSRDRSLRIRSAGGGFAGRNGATQIWQYAGDPLWMGWDPPATIAGWEPIVWTSSTAGAWLHPHGLTLPTGEVLVHAQVGVAGGSVNVYQASRNPTTGLWTTSTVRLGAVQNQDCHPTIVRLPSGDLVTFFWVEDTTSSTANIRMLYSTDAGATWTAGSSGCLPEDIDTSAGAAGYVLGRLRAAYKDGQILLIAAISSNDVGDPTRDILVQYASDDLGSSFSEVVRFDKTLGGADQQGGNYQDVLVVDGMFMVFWVRLTADWPTVVRIGSAFEPISYAAQVSPQATTGLWATDDTQTFLDGDLAATVDEAGVIYLQGRILDATSVWVSVRSADGGATWVPHGRRAGLTTGNGVWCDMNDANTHFRDACAVWQRGRVIVIPGHTATPSTYVHGISAVYLGGPADVTMPSFGLAKVDTQQVMYTGNYLPLDLPEDVGWTLTVFGAPTATNTTGPLVMAAAVGESVVYTIDPGGTPDEGMIADVVIQASAGTGFFHARLGSATHGFEVRIDISGTSLAAWDTVSATQIGTTATITSGAILELKLGLIGNDATVWWRNYTTGERRQWTQLGQRLAMTDDAAATFTTPQLKMATGLGGAQTVTVYMVNWTTGSDAVGAMAGLGLSGGQSNPTELFPRRLSTELTYVDDGVLVAGTSGPTRGGEIWDINTRYDYPVDNLLPSTAPSPRATWRSCPTAELLGTTAWLHLAWTIDSHAEDSYGGSEVLAFYLDALNCPAAQIDIYYGGAWHNVATTGMIQFSGSRTGGVVQPGGASTFGTKHRLNFHRGDGIAFYSGGYTVVDWRGKVAGNTEGITNTSAGTSKKAAFFIDQTVGSSTTPAVGIWPRRHLIVIRNPAGLSRSFRGVRLRLPVSAGTAYPGNPIDGFFETGAFVWGPMWVFGSDYSRERTLRLTPNVELYTASDGSRRSRVLGPPSRTVEFSWIDGVDVSDFRKTAAPNYVLASANASAAPAAFKTDTPLQVMDFVAGFDGASTPILYCPSIDFSSSTGAGAAVKIYSDGDAHGALWGRITSPVEVTQVVGSEEESEVYRVASIVIEEEP